MRAPRGYDGLKINKFERVQELVAFAVEKHVNFNDGGPYRTRNYRVLRAVDKNLVLWECFRVRWCFRSD